MANNNATTQTGGEQSPPVMDSDFREREAYALTTSFSGADCIAYAVIPPNFEAVRMQGRSGLATADQIYGSRPFMLGTIQTLSYNSHRPAFPVIPFGHTRPIAFTSSTRTIGGALVFGVFDSNVMVDLYRSFFGTRHTKSNEQFMADTVPLTNTDGSVQVGGCISGTGAYGNNASRNSDAQFLKNAGIMLFAELADELPPLDIHLMSVNEAGHQSYMALHNVKFLDESMTISVEDIYSELMIQFMCSSITPLQTQTRRIESRNKLFLDSTNVNDDNSAAASAVFNATADAAGAIVGAFSFNV